MHLLKTPPHRHFNRWFFVPIFLIASSIVIWHVTKGGSQSAVKAATVTPWSMAGANPQRTSWTPDEAPGPLSFQWTKPIAAEVSDQAQPTAAENLVFVPTSRGLYAFDNVTGEQVWVFGTELPILNAPTYDAGYLYFGGMDKKIYKIKASDKSLQWSFAAEGGFDGNPVVINNTVYLGSRDGNFYAINASNGQLAWKYTVGAQILQSAAYSSSNGGRLFFGAMDGKAYALNANGTLAWSVKLPTAGWTGHWPVIYKDKVIFTKTGFSRNSSQNFTGDISLYTERDWLFGPPPYDGTDPENDLPAADMNSSSIPTNWEVGTKKGDLRVNPIGTHNTVIDFLEINRHSRSVFFLDQTTGSEATFDLDSDGTLDAPPILRTASDGQTTYPPLIRGCTGCDSVLYFRNPIVKSGNFSGSMVVGWNYGTPYVSFPVSQHGGTSYDWPMDEYAGISGGGNFLHWNIIIGRNVGGVDLSKPNPNFPSTDFTRQWRYVNSGDSYPTGTYSQAAKFYWEPGKTKPDGGLYYEHGWSMGPTIYNGRLFEVTGNALVAFGPGPAAPSQVKSTAGIPTTVSSTAVTLPIATLQTKLAAEVQKVLAAGHLKPGYAQYGTYDSYQEALLGDHLGDYWGSPADALYPLIRALPHLNTDLQAQLKTYIVNEYNQYPPHLYSHTGWKDGAYRQPWDWPPGMAAGVAGKGPVLATDTQFSDWNMPPFAVYTMWKYSQAGLADAPSTFAKIKDVFKSTITQNKGQLNDTYLASMPHVLNAYIAGYIGYINLANAAGTPASSAYTTELARLQNLRVSIFTVNLLPPVGMPIGAARYYYVLRPNMNYMYMTPELGDYMAAHQSNGAITTGVKINTDEAAYPPENTNNGPRAPFWMVAHNRDVQAENGITPYQQTQALFAARAYILKDSQSTLTKYLDTPIMPTGDLYYIQNLVTVLEAGTNPPPPSTPPAPSPTASPPPVCTPSGGDLDNSGKVTTLDLTKLIGVFGTTTPTMGDLNCDQKVNSLDISILLGNL